MNHETLTRLDIARGVSEATEIEAGKAQAYVKDLFDEISNLTMNEGRQVSLSRFGVFFPAEKAARPGRNPKTGEDFTIAARVRLSFRPSDLIKEALING